MRDVLRLEGKDWFREPEAAEYCGLSVDEFRNWYPEAGIIPRRVGAGKRGRKLYSRASLFQAIDNAPEWPGSTSAANRGISAGLRVADRIAPPLGPLAPGRRRDYVPRKKQS